LQSRRSSTQSNLKKVKTGARSLTQSRGVWYPPD
jgi:hypothetical protein